SLGYFHFRHFSKCGLLFFLHGIPAASFLNRARHGSLHMGAAATSRGRNRVWASTASRLTEFERFITPGDPPAPGFPTQRHAEAPGWFRGPAAGGRPAYTRRQFRDRRHRAV